MTIIIKFSTSFSTFALLLLGFLRTAVARQATRVAYVTDNLSSFLPLKENKHVSHGLIAIPLFSTERPFTTLIPLKRSEALDLTPDNKHYSPLYSSPPFFNEK